MCASIEDEWLRLQTHDVQYDNVWLDVCAWTPFGLDCRITVLPANLW